MSDDFKIVSETITDMIKFNRVNVEGKDFIVRNMTTGAYADRAIVIEELDPNRETNPDGYKFREYSSISVEDPETLIRALQTLIVERNKRLGKV